MDVAAQEGFIKAIRENPDTTNAFEFANKVNTFDAASKSAFEVALSKGLDSSTAFDVAPVISTHRVGLIVNELFPASLKRGSNSVPLKFGLFKRSQRPKYSKVFLSRIQFLTTSLGSTGFFCLAICLCCCAIHCEFELAFFQTAGSTHSKHLNFHLHKRHNPKCLM
jgi:hypothetical protein